jgi:hypothetical protein
MNSCNGSAAAVRKLRYFIPALTAVVVAAACADPFGPREWDATPRAALLYSLSRPDLIGLPSAFDFVELGGVPIELPGLTGNWDVALVDHDGGLALLPAGAFDGIESRAAIAVLPGRVLEDVLEAPGDTAAYTMGPVRIEANTVYVVRTRRGPCQFGASGFRYAKLTATFVDVPGGRLGFNFVRNPFCNDRSFVPPTS